MKKNTVKDVGLLTWHYYNNVGSALQAYALYEAIKKEGYSCEFINYRKFIDKNIFYKGIRWICSRLTDVFPHLLPEAYRFRIYSFQKKYFEESEYIKNAEQLGLLNMKYRCFVCGSDQIWAPNVLDPVYLLNFVDEDKYRCSYAASIGLNSIPDTLKVLYSENLNKFERISVREKQGEHLLKEFIERPVYTVLDPTFLLGRKEWECLLEQVPAPIDANQYIFCYFLGDIDASINKIYDYAEKNGMRVIRFEPNGVRRNGIKKYMGPEEFLRYVKDAYLVLTDSFHGVALSINLEKNFFALKRFSDDDVLCQNSRVINILDICGLSNRLLEQIILIDENIQIDYERVNIQLERERRISREYLCDCLEEGIAK